jgi:hypothetical protein
MMMVAMMMVAMMGVVGLGFVTKTTMMVMDSASSS